MANLLSKINENDDRFICLKAYYDHEDLLYSEDKDGKPFYIWFIGKNSLPGRVEEIIISENVLNDLHEYAILQLSEPGFIGTRPSPAADEFVYISFSNGNGDVVKYQRCYG